MKRRLFFCAFIFCVFSAFSLESLPFNNSDVQVQSQEMGINSTLFSQFGEYSPFNPSGQGNTSGVPILYGPGGEPIGGLPIKDGTQLLFLTVMGYAIFKSVQVRVRKKRS